MLPYSHVPQALASLTRQTSALISPDAGALMLSPRSQRMAPHLLGGGAGGPSAMCHIDISAEYTAGCSRAHAARLSVPVSTPFR